MGDVPDQPAPGEDPLKEWRRYLNLPEPFAQVPTLREGLRD